MQYSAGERPYCGVDRLRLALARAEANLSAVEATMRALTNDEFGLGTAMQEQLWPGGKRLRARISLAASQLCGVCQADAIAGASAVELAHNASLVHDDLIDGDRERRGRPTTWAGHGRNIALLAGDHLLASAFSAAAQTTRGSELTQLLAARIRAAACGQAQEVSSAVEGRYDNSPSPLAVYEKAIRGKSGALFVLPVEIAFVLAGQGGAALQAAGAAWCAFGAAYQVQNDLDELYGRNPGRSRQSDLLEGRYTAPVVCFLESATAEDADALRTFLANRRPDTVGANVWRQRLQLTDSTRRAYILHARLMAEARTASAALSDGHAELLEWAIASMPSLQADVEHQALP